MRPLNLIIAFLLGFPAAFSQAIYAGGIGDGYAVSCYKPFSYPKFPIYSGGIEDGYAVNCYNPFSYPKFPIYSGGIEDGYAVSCYKPFSYPEFPIYSGGIEDGYAINCTPILFGFLPVTRLNFEAVLKEEKVFLFWETARELNVSYFEVEKSPDMINWISLGKVKALGTSYENSSYNYTDAFPYSGVSYYRIKQVDNTGVYTYSAIRRIINNHSDVFIFPNPTTEDLNIIAEGIEIKHLRFFDLLGRELPVEKFSQKQGHDKILLDIHELPSGMYFLKVREKFYKVLLEKE